MQWLEDTFWMLWRKSVGAPAPVLGRRLAHLLSRPASGKEVPTVLQSTMQQWQHARGTVHQLPETPDGVLPNTLSRLGSNMYQGTLRSGTIWRGDAELLRSLPQGEARLATLQTRERVAHAKAKAKAKAKVEEEPPRDKDEFAESRASRRGGGEHGEPDAPDRGGGAELRGPPPKKETTNAWTNVFIRWLSTS